MSGASYSDAFLQAIAEEPDDDTPRLAFADWLDEHGDPERAEFIRAQVGLAKMSPGDPRRAGLEGRAAALKKAHGVAWVRPLPPHAADGPFHRGFLEDVQFAGPREFFAIAGEVLRRLPIRRLTIHAHEGNSLDADGVRALTALPQLARLNALRLWDHPFGEEGVAILAACPLLANLRALSVANCQVGPDGAAALAASPHLANLVELDLCGNNIDVDGGRALLNSTHLTRLALLDIGANYYGREAGEDELLEELEEHFGEGLRFCDESSP